MQQSEPTELDKDNDMNYTEDNMEELLAEDEYYQQMQDDIDLHWWQEIDNQLQQREMEDAAQRDSN